MTVQGRQGVFRAQPYGAQQTYIDEPVADQEFLLAVFDIAIVVTDPNQYEDSATAAIQAVGPYLDAVVVSDSIGTVDVAVMVDGGGTFYSILPAPLALSANQPLVINGLRVPGRFIRVSYQNTSGGAAITDFGAYMRSN